MQINYNSNDFKRFCELVRDQFEYGGKKYALGNSDIRESTDELFDTFGRNWLYGTMAKYCYRFRNLKRERDILKIACYTFLLWLKKGYFCTLEGLQKEALDTNIAIKTMFFDKYIAELESRAKTWYDWYDNKDLIQSILDQLTKLAKADWWCLTQFELAKMFFTCYNLWIQEKYNETQKHDTDTYQK